MLMTHGSKQDATDKALHKHNYRVAQQGRFSTPRCGKAHRKWFDKPAFTRCVAGVDDDRQVGQLMEHGNGSQIQSIAGVGIEGADAALAEDVFQ